MAKITPISVKITQDLDSKDASFVAYSPELDIASAGPTKNEALKNLREAISLVLDGAKEDGKLEEFLEEAGFSEINGEFKPRRIEFEQLSITI